jgi:hypothetical protein
VRHSKNFQKTRQQRIFSDNEQGARHLMKELRYSCRKSTGEEKIDINHLASKVSSLKDPNIYMAITKESS